MPPHATDIPPAFEPQQNRGEDKGQEQRFSSSSGTREYYWTVAQGSLNTVIHWLVAAVSFVTTWFAFRNIDNAPLNVNAQHIVLCTLGFQLLMAEAILSFAAENSWSRAMTTRHKRAAHWVMQLVGSALAIYGCAISITIRSAHFVSIHGATGILAMVLTGVSFINGLTALYAGELKGIMKPKYNKILHIVCGTIAFVLANVSLIDGFLKNSFMNWAGVTLTNTIIALTAIMTAGVVISPLVNTVKKVKS